MKVKALLIVWCVLLSRAVFAQGAPAADPISGAWGKGAQALLDLKYDGKGGITGTIVGGRPDNVAPIKTGTFDAATGALKLTGDARNPETGETMAFVIEGTLKGDALSVSATFGTTKGDHTLTRITTASGTPAGGIATALQTSFAEASRWVSEAAELVPAEKYAYRPVTTVRTFGDLVGHVADAYTYYCAQAGGSKAQWSDAIEKGTKDKAALTAKLKQALDGCTAVYAKGGDSAALVENIGHTNLHYGNMITYIRMLGLVPPSSK